MQSVITPSNWTYCRYESGDYRAFISFGADPASLESKQYLYFLTVTEGTDKEVYQQTFDGLSKACESINLRYGSEWKLNDQTAAKEGCSSCVAH